MLALVVAKKTRDEQSVFSGRALRAGLVIAGAKAQDFILPCLRHGLSRALIQSRMSALICLAWRPPDVRAALRGRVPHVSILRHGKPRISIRRGSGIGRFPGLKVQTWGTQLQGQIEIWTTRQTIRIAFLIAGDSGIEARTFPSLPGHIHRT